ncbi:DCL family protein [Streptomyces microflavus]|uniref:DCL family protein n=1 Tax=Streptomyces microflavus TaxID=1919 RepID=UPI002E345211|nr:DCL family protein [Streptomyces microflavus]
MAIPVSIGNEHFPTKAAAIARCQEILRAYPGTPGSGPGQPQAVTDPAHIAFLQALIARHPEAKERTKPGIAGFKVQVNPEGIGNTRCFYVVHPDGSSIRFSFKSCL